MIKTLAALALLAASTAGAEAQTFSNNGHMIALRCQDWKQNLDGSWSQTRPIMVGAMTIKGYTLYHTAETRVLDQQCRQNGQH